MLRQPTQYLPTSTLCTVCPLGLEAGTIVVSEKVVNVKLKEEHDVVSS